MPRRMLLNDRQLCEMRNAYRFGGAKLMDLPHVGAYTPFRGTVRNAILNFEKKHGLSADTPYQLPQKSEGADPTTDQAPAGV